LKQKQRLFIYDRKELAVLFLLGFTVAVFAFTLGVHLGKRVGPKGMSPPPGEIDPVKALSDKVPNRVELAEESKGVQAAVEETLDQELHDEVARSGVKLDSAKQVELPDNSKAPQAGATTLNHGSPKPASAAPPSGSHGQFALQIGSFPTEADAAAKLKSMSSHGLKMFVKEADVKGVGKRYRLYVGGFGTKAAAEGAGEKYRSQHMIDSFIVAKLSE